MQLYTNDTSLGRDDDPRRTRRSGLRRPLQRPLADAPHKKINSHGVLRTPRHDDVGVAFCWEDELVEGGFNELFISPQDAVDVPTSFSNISPNTSCESDIGVRIDKDLQVHEIS